MAQNRFYVHGDQSESCKTEIYCGICDVFFTLDHFHATHGLEKNLQRYEKGIVNLKLINKSRVNLVRPALATNIFDGVR